MALDLIRPTRASIILSIVISSLLGCAGRPSELLLQSTETDRQLGMEVSRQVAQQMGIVDKPAVFSYLSEIGHRLTGQIVDRRFDYTFQIVDQPEPNAFAAPGGFVYVSRGLLALANSEDELANVVAHEIVHVDRRHTAKQLSRQRLPSLFTLPGRAVGRVISQDLGNILNLPAATVGASFMASYSRQHELEADELGQQLSARAGYDPAALAAILEQIERQEQLQTGTTKGFSFFNTHPTAPRRVRDITERAQSISRAKGVGVARDKGVFLERLEGITVGTNPANGIFQGQKFLHPDLDFFIEFPRDWKTVNARHAVGAISPRQDALIFIGVIGVGSGPEEIARAFRAALEAEFGIAPSRSDAVKIGDWPAYLLTFTDHSGREPVYMHFLWVGARGFIYQMIGLATERYGPALRETALAFRPLTAEEKASIQVTRVHIVSARAGEDLDQFSERTGNIWDPQETAVMNGIAVDTPLQAGPIKIAVSEPYKPASLPSLQR